MVVMRLNKQSVCGNMSTFYKSSQSGSTNVEIVSNLLTCALLITLRSPLDPAGVEGFNSIVARAVVTWFLVQNNLTLITILLKIMKLIRLKISSSATLPLPRPHNQ